MMKAIVVHKTGGPEVMRLQEVGRPVPGAGQVIIKIRAAGVNPVDTYIRAGAYPNSKVPYTPGFDAAGTVEELGPGVIGFKLGDHVYTSETISGAYAEYALCDAAKIHRFPETISFNQAAGLNIPYATAYRALFQKANIQPGETLLVHGASGAVGLAAVQWARTLGLKIIGTAGTKEGAKLVKEQGAAHVLNHTRKNYHEEILRLTGGRGVDVILEMLANVNLGADLTLLAKNGRVVIIGNRGKAELNPRDAMAREAVIYGLMLFLAPDNEYVAIHSAIGAALQKNQLQPIIGKTFPLDQAPKAHDAVLAPGAFGKIVLVP
jgi:NADPH:quinone reductase